MKMNNIGQTEWAIGLGTCHYAAYTMDWRYLSRSRTLCNLELFEHLLQKNAHENDLFAMKLT
jgi:hypothetical protein